MSHKREGQLTVSGEWARHLRPFLRRAFWKGERQAVRDLLRNEGRSVPSSRQNKGTLEDLLACVEAIPPGVARFDLWVPEHLTLSESAVGQEAAMAVLLDKLLAKSLFPLGFVAETGGRVYQYQRE